MLVSVKSAFPKKIVVMIALAVNIFETMITVFSFLCFKPWRICLKIGFAIPCYISVVFEFMQTIVFLMVWSIHMIYIYGMISFLAVLALRNIWIHAYFSDCSNMIFYIEAPINKAFFFYSSLWTPNVNPYHSHVRFGRDFDYTRVEN